MSRALPRPVAPRRAWLVALGLCACGAGLPVDPNPFGDPRPVALLGYGGVAMEPALSPDGTILLFNDSNAPGADTDLHWATRIDPLSFAYQGPVVAANSNALDAVPSLDQAGTLYFISTRSYAPDHRVTVHRAAFQAGVASGVEEVPGLESRGVGWIIFDAFVSIDGTQLWFAEGNQASGSFTHADLGLAVRQPSGAFQRVDGTDLFRAVNQAIGIQYAPAVSADGLDLYFTRLTGTGTTTAVYASHRTSTAAPWGTPAPIEALVGGVIEAATPTTDGRALYYHRLGGAGYELARVTRR